MLPYFHLFIFVHIVPSFLGQASSLYFLSFCITFLTPVILQEVGTFINLMKTGKTGETVMILYWSDYAYLRV